MTGTDDGLGAVRALPDPGGGYIAWAGGVGAVRAGDSEAAALRALAEALAQVVLRQMRELADRRYPSPSACEHTEIDRYTGRRQGETLLQAVRRCIVSATAVNIVTNADRPSAPASPTASCCTPSTEGRATVDRVYITPQERGGYVAWMGLPTARGYGETELEAAVELANDLAGAVVEHRRAMAEMDRRARAVESHRCECADVARLVDRLPGESLPEAVLRFVERLREVRVERQVEVVGAEQMDRLRRELSRWRKLASIARHRWAEVEAINELLRRRCKRLGLPVHGDPTEDR